MLHKHLVRLAFAAKFVSRKQGFVHCIFTVYVGLC